MPPSMPVRQQAPQTPLDMGDPVAQTLAAMHGAGTLAPESSGAQHLPAEAGIHTLMQNLLHNSVATQDSSLGMRALAAIGDALDAGKHGVQSMMGTDQADIDQRLEQLSQILPAPRTRDLLNPVQGMGRFGAELLSTGTTDRRWSPETVKIAGNMATDPTTYFGLGLLKGLAKGAAGAGAPIIVQKTLRSAQVGDEAATAAMGAFGDAMVGIVQKGLARPNAELAKLMPDLVKWTAYAKQTSAMNDALQWLEHRNLDLNTIQNGLKQGSLTMQDVVEQLPTGMRTTVDPAHLEMALTRMPTTTNARNVAKWASTTQPTAERAVAYENYKTWLRHDMGIDDPNRARTFYSNFTDWWKQQALGSIGYLEQNAKGGLLGSLISTGPGGAARTAADLFDNAGNILRGTPFNTSDAMAMSARGGVPIPASLHEAADRALNANVGSSTARTLLGSTTKDVIGGAALGAFGAQETDQNPVIGALLGGVTMGKLPAIATRLRKSSQGIETVLRERGWVEGMSKAWTEDMLRLNDEVAQILTAPGPKGGKSPVSNSLSRTIADQISQEGVQVSADQVRQQLLSRVKVTPQRAEDAARTVDDALYEASRGGVKTSNEFNFDYQDLSPIERAITTVAPFATWYLKAVPYFTKQGLKHPVLGSLLQDESSASAQMQQERGLPTRFTGTIPQQGQGSLMSVLVGRPLEAFQNPLAALLPFGSLGRDIAASQYDDEDTSPLAQVTKIALNQLGLNPLITTGARVAGIGSDMNDPATQNLLRTGAPIAGLTALAAKGVEAATGQNPGWNLNTNSGLQKIEEKVREMGDAAAHGGQGRQVQDTTQLAIERRVDELALKATGAPLSSDNAASIPYIRAKRDMKGPIWEQAKNEVAQEKGAQSLIGFVSPTLRPDAVLTPEEGQIRQAKAGPLLDPQVARTIDTAAEKAPAEMADPKALAAITTAVQTIAEKTGRPTPDPVAQRLAAPTNANLDWISKEVYKWQAEQDPLVQGYGSSGSMEQRRIANDQGVMSVAGRGLDPATQAALIANNRASSVAQHAAPSRTILQGSNQGLGGGIIAAAKAIPGQERDAIQAQNPLLTEYYAWRTTHPGMEVADFLKEKYGK
jgi:hypothetical protein